ncbi:hypothetical protein [Paenibacillus sp. FSL H3-0333]
MKTIKLIKRDGSLVIKTTGDSLKLLELATYVKHDVITYQGDVIEMVVSA